MSETSPDRHIKDSPMRLIGVSVLLVALGVVLAGPASVRPASGTPASSAAVAVSWGSDLVAVSWGSCRQPHAEEA